ncbi:ArsR/SmtB family transcription factor [Microlunatus elymi]|nr:helix-turn-helix domain-containing protein [Microlunatus elymi]
MWELIGSVQLLQLNAAQRPVGYESWVRRWRVGRKQPAVRNAAGVLAAIAPRSAYFPDFLTPDQPTGGFEDEVDTVLSTPLPRLRSEIGQLDARRPWLSGMAKGDTTVLTRFGDVLRGYYRALVEPDRTAIETAIGTHRADVMQTMMQGGVEAVLDTLFAGGRWRSPWLESAYPVERTVELKGRGLLLVPSFFCFRMPVMLADDSLDPVLVYPIEHAVGEAGSDGIAELIGSTRAAVLSSIADGASTSEVAARVGISLATASHHTTILRQAGLVTSIRRANSVVHSPSSLGYALLGAGPG